MSDEIHDDWSAQLGSNPPRVVMAEKRETVTIPRRLFESLAAHYRETSPIRSKQPQVDVRELVDLLDRPYVPAVIDYDACGESEFVLFDTLTIAHDGPGYVILKDVDGNVIGFRWSTARPPHTPPPPPSGSPA